VVDKSPSARPPNKPGNCKAVDHPRRGMDFVRRRRAGGNARRERSAQIIEAEEAARRIYGVGLEEIEETTRLLDEPKAVIGNACPLRGQRLSSIRSHSAVLRDITQENHPNFPLYPIRVY
jgi:hypothetical protein